MRIQGSDNNYNFQGLFWLRALAREHYESARQILIVNSGYRITLRH